MTEGFIRDLPWPVVNGKCKLHWTFNATRIISHTVSAMGDAGLTDLSGQDVDNGGVDVSVVIPTYRAAATLPPLVARLEGAAKASRRCWEIIIVDDGSPDETWQVLKKLKAASSMRVRLVRLMTNAGQHNALIAGIQVSKGRYVVTMDDDLQHAPESVETLIEGLDSGRDLVIAAFPEKHHILSRNLGGRVVDRIIRNLFDLPRSFQLTSFRAVRGKIARSAAETHEAYPYLTALLLANARAISNVEIEHQPNTARPSHYSLFKSVRLAANLVFGYSSIPVMLILLFGGVAVLTALIAFLWAAISTLAGSSTVPGWASTIAMIAVFNGLNLAALAALAVYIGRMHRQLTGRQRIFTIDEIDD